MEGHHEARTRRTLRIGTLASAIVLAAGVTACDSGGQAPASPSTDQAAQSEPDLGDRPADIDIGARSSETGNAARNEAASRENVPPSGSADTAPGAETAPAGNVSAGTASPGNTSSGNVSAETAIATTGSTDAVAASAVLEPVDGSGAHGDASFIETEQGLEIVVTMAGLEPGQHGIHVHENGDCSGQGAEGAGSHFNPSGTEHGAPSDDPSERHAGDLGNLSADASGEADLNLTDEVLTVEGENGVAGRAIIVHGGQDDFESQPSGDSGDPVACGVIETSARG